MVGVYCSVEGCWDPCGGSAKKHRFPNPAKNLELFNKWVTLCGNKRLYEEHVTPEKIYNNHRVCHKHFDNSDLLENGVLKSTAFPHVNMPVSIDNKENICSNVETCLKMDENVKTHMDMTSQSTDNAEPIAQVDEVVDQPSTSRILNTPPRGPPSGLLSEVSVSRSEDLTPKARHLYKRATYFKRRAAASTKSKISFKERLEEVEKFTESEAFGRVLSSMDRIKARFFESQIENINKKSQGRRYSLEDKVLALALFKQCGSGYKLLSKIFSLPSRKTVMRLLNRIPVEPGLCEPIFDVLQAEVKTFKDPLQKYCTLIFDEMSVKPGLYWNSFNASVEGFENFGYKRTNSIANHVQVFMLRGIKNKWKQPVFYNFVNGATKHTDIVHILKLIIRKCLSVGLEVVATICDQGRNNEAAINSLISQTKREYDQKKKHFNEDFFEIDGEKVVPLFDAPHLIKGLRNNFLKYNIEFVINGKTCVAKWDHILKAYKMDPYLGSLRTMPKLTEHHVNPNHIYKMKVSYCTQVLSRTVAAAINLMAISGTQIQTEEGVLVMEKKASETAQFLEFADNLFDSVNGQSVTHNPLKPLLSPVTENSAHFKFWNDAIAVLSSVKYLKEDGSFCIPPSVKNFIRTLKNFRTLYHILKDAGFEELLPRVFNQDPIENFFGRIRQRGARYNNPTCASFTPFYKSLLVKDLTSHHSLGSNCEDDESEIFITLQRFVSQGLCEEDDDDDDDDNEDYVNLSYLPSTFNNKLQLTEIQVLKYVCGYLLKKAQTSFNDCECAKIILELEEQGTEESDFFINLRQYKNAKLKYISNYFLLKMTEALQIIKFILNRNLHKKNIFAYMHKILCQKINFTDCNHNSIMKETIFKYFIKVTGHNFLKQLNQIMHGNDRRAIPANAPEIFKQCKNIFKTTYKK